MMNSSGRLGEIAFVIVLSHEKTGSSHIPLVRSIGSSFKRETCFGGGNLIKIYTNQCQVVNGKKQCPVYCNGRGTFDQQTRFEIVKYNSKKCIQFDDGSTRYSLKVISKTDVIFEEQSACDTTTSHDFLFKEEKNTAGKFIYKYTSSTNQALYLGVSANFSDENIFIISTTNQDKRCFMERWS
ncbi:uncharacterized protein [Pocillopora verrucosa]|uniref:uncharacterized protein n=1 Tax=Pocillopora verrucosa TaxID=203993 RepID=UPI0033404251